MKNENQTTPALIQITEAAANKIKTLMVKEPEKRRFLRVFIAGASCAGFQYGFTYEEKQDDDETIITHKMEFNGEQTKIDLIVDSASLAYLKGSTIDFQKTELGERFIVNNPNEQGGGCSSCSGCGPTT